VDLARISCREHDLHYLSRFVIYPELPDKNNRNNRPGVLYHAHSRRTLSGYHNIAFNMYLGEFSLVSRS
jgi:hypothetical protein